MDGRDTVTVQLISPATTLGSIVAAERCLALQVTSKSDKQNFKQKWSLSSWSLLPFFMAIISIIQVLTFMLSDAQTNKLLRFEPSLRWQAWRFVSYMILHFGKTHLILNVVIQCLIATPLEVEQGGSRTLIVYLGGGVFGGLGACILQPQPMVGASAGVYALLISHLAHLYLNWSMVKYRKYRVFSVCVLSISDMAFYAFHARNDGNPPISLSAHASGGLAGALIGLVVYKGAQDEPYKPIKYVKIIAFIAILILLTGAIIAMCILPTEFFRR